MFGMHSLGSPPSLISSARALDLRQELSVTPPLQTYLNKSVLVGLPVLFGDVQCRPCRLADITPNGLWLEIEGMAERLIPHEALSFASESLTMFVPFAQISCVIGAVARGDRPVEQASVPAKHQKRPQNLKKHK